jgi:transposase-like protein
VRAFTYRLAPDELEALRQRLEHLRRVEAVPCPSHLRHNRPIEERELAVDLAGHTAAEREVPAMPPVARGGPASRDGRELSAQGPSHPATTTAAEIGLDDAGHLPARNHCRAPLVASDRRDAFEADLRSGASRGEIAEAWGLTERQLIRWCNNHRVPCPSGDGRSGAAAATATQPVAESGTLTHSGAVESGTPTAPADTESGAGRAVRQERFIAALREVIEELSRARRQYPPMHSAHEGWAVIYEEVCELWEAVRQGDRPQQRLEGVQVAAMALRLLIDVLHGRA